MPCQGLIVFPLGCVTKTGRAVSVELLLVSPFVGTKTSRAVSAELLFWFFPLWGWVFVLGYQLWSCSLQWRSKVTAVQFWTSGPADQVFGQVPPVSFMTDLDGELSVLGVCYSGLRFHRRLHLSHVRMGFQAPSTSKSASCHARVHSFLGVAPHEVPRAWRERTTT